MRRFRLVLFLCGFFLLMVAAPALAQGENVPVSLEQAIRTARANLSIPPECTVFSSGFEQGPPGSFWQLNWLSPRGLRNVSVNVDAGTGEIVSFHSFRGGGEPTGRLPRYTREEMRPVAEALVKKLAPQKWGVLRLEAAPGRSWDLSQHTFIYVRYVNGIPFPENGVRVVVDGNTKEVVEYTLNWTAEAAFPVAKGMLPREEALRRYREQVQPHLQYFVPVAPENPERQRPHLVYSLEPGELAVDAFTGKVLTGMTPAGSLFGEMFGMPGGGGEKAFSPAEQREIEAVGELLPAVKAAAVVRELVPQVATADLERSSLNVGGPWQEEKVWQLSFSNKDRRLRINAVISAVTGELLHLYVMATEDEEPRPPVAAKRQEAKLDREEARRVAEEFLKRAAPALLPEARCAQCEFFGLPYPNPAYNCVYQRYVNGLPCPSNSLSVQVDAVTGEVIGAYALTEPTAGSDAMAIRTRATRTADGGFVLDGTKQFISNASFADVFTVFAKVDGEHHTAFIVERRTPGLTVGPEEHKMGIRGSSTASLIFEGVRVPADAVLGEIGQGHKIAFNILNVGRFTLAAGVTGAARYALGQATGYARERRQFNRALVDFGLIRQKLARLATAIYVAESMVYRTGGLVAGALGAQHQDPAQVMAALEEYAVECSIAKVFASEMLDLVVDEMVQIYGGYGFIEDYPAARAYRDARINRIFEGTNEINRLLIPGMLFRRALKGRLDLLGAARAVADEVLAPALPDGGERGPLDEARRLADAARKATLFAAGAAAQKHLAALEHQQELLGWIADLVIETFAVESAVLRAVKAASRGDPAAGLHAAMVHLYLDEALPRMETTARRLLAATAQGDTLRTMLAGLRRFLKVPAIDAVATARTVADAVVAAGGYPV